MTKVLKLLKRMIKILETDPRKCSEKSLLLTYLENVQKDTGEARYFKPQASFYFLPISHYYQIGNEHIQDKSPHTDSQSIKFILKISSSKRCGTIPSETPIVGSYYVNVAPTS